MPDALPVGASCWATETEDGGATRTTIDFDSATNAVEVTEDDLPIAITATNTFDVGSLTVEKILTGPGVPFADQAFVLDVTCTHAGRTINESVRLTATDLTASVTGLPTGARCTVTEDSPYGGADGPATITPEQPVVIGADPEQPVVVQATNTFSVGSVTVTKIVNGPARDLVGNPAFTLGIQCVRSIDGRPGAEVLRQTFGLRAGESRTFDQLPLFTTCRLSELDDGGATATTITSASVTIDPDEPEATLTATNTCDTGTLRLRKTISGDKSARPPAGTVFAVDVSCRFSGEPVTGFDPLTVALETGDTGGLSKTLGPLPVGAVCTATETDSGGATSTTITPDQPATVVAGDPLTITIDNHYSVRPKPSKEPSTPPTTQTTTPPRLSETGAPALGPILALAAALLAGGAGLIGYSRRRRTGTHT